MLNDVLAEALDDTGVTLEQFRELCLRLLNHGVLCRDETQIEQQLYDRFLRVQGLVEDYFDVVGLQLYHDPRFAVLRVYPPGARVPGMPDAAEETLSGGLRARFRQDEVALLLVLRQQYDQGLREGRLDEHGCVSESIESISIALRNLLDRSLPEKLTDRKRAFSRLRQLRLIRYRPEEAFESAEAGIKIHPMIVDFVTEDALAAMEQALPVDEVDHVS